MKRYLIPVLAILPLLSSCTYNTETGTHEVSIMFWFFIAGISLSVIAIIILMIQFTKRRNRNKKK